MVTEHERLLQALYDGAATPRQAALLLAVRRRVYDLAFCRRHTS
ncbi:MULTISPECIES: hypothetical protein [Paraburkholderia]|jgi:hypothetical protein|nr:MULTISPECIES: hypothetical protein [Paraburkholderia]GJH01021.1 hypothetical protein CBA19C8_10710 [Paraburkholderia terrae]GJH33900.1 hypothetical protein CBA19CS91_14105 [Paraburkholderia hospita]